MVRIKFLLTLSLIPFMLMLVCIVAWFYSMMIATVGVLEIAAGSNTVSDQMLKDLESFMNRLYQIMGLEA